MYIYLFMDMWCTVLVVDKVRYVLCFKVRVLESFGVEWVGLQLVSYMRYG